uniref:Uncharacterized protein n=1 Tax=Strongyloides venezuelensis TaxID=75913 RepID=A0A0K0FWC5_STRVS
MTLRNLRGVKELAKDNTKNVNLAFEINTAVKILNLLLKSVALDHDISYRKITFYYPLFILKDVEGKVKSSNPISIYTFYVSLDTQER